MSATERVEEGFALLSPDLRYRYRLSRTLTDHPANRPVLWVMLNPSTADANTLDPTLRRCVGFSRMWGFDRMLIGNLYALRSTDPKGLWLADDPVGPENDHHLAAMAHMAEIVVVGWGANAKHERANAALRVLRDNHIFCLGKTKGGAPRHPLYLSHDTALEKFP